MSLPNEIFSDITNFLPNDDKTDLMLLSRNFNAILTPRLKKIDEEMTTVNQSIESFMPAPEPTDYEWIPQLNLKRFKPVGSEAKKRMKEAFEDHKEFHNCQQHARGIKVYVKELSSADTKPRMIMAESRSGKICDEWISRLNLKKLPTQEPSFCRWKIDTFKKRMSLQRFDDARFFRILGALVAMPKFREEYNVSNEAVQSVRLCNLELKLRYGTHDDVLRIWKFYNEDPYLYNTNSDSGDESIGSYHDYDSYSESNDSIDDYVSVNESIVNGDTESYHSTVSLYNHV